MPYKLIASDNAPKSVQYTPVGTAEIKRIIVPVAYRAGRFKLRTHFSSPHSPSSIVPYANSNEHTGLLFWDPTSFQYEVEFDATNLEWVACGRRESGNLKLTSTIFELYYETEEVVTPPEKVYIYFEVLDSSRNPLPDALIKLNGAVYHPAESGITDPIEVPPDKDYNVTVSVQNEYTTSLAVDAKVGDMTIQLESVEGFPTAPGAHAYIAGFWIRRKRYYYIAISGNTLTLQSPIEGGVTAGIPVVVYKRDKYYGEKAFPINTGAGGLFYVTLPEEIEIINISQKEEASPGETVNVSMMVKSLSPRYGKKFEAGASGTTLHEYFELNPGETKKLTGSFVMGDMPKAVWYYASYFTGSAYVIGDQREVKTALKAAPTPPPPECEEGIHEVLEYCPDGVTEKRWRDCVKGKWVTNSRTCPIAPECSEGAHEVLEYCPDGVTEKKWRDCVKGKWVTNSRTCPVAPECSEGAREVLEYCPDGVTEKRWRVCIKGKWVTGSQRCPGEPEPFPCPIMCIAMGTPLVDALGPIREFRDRILRRSKVGRWFISFYYNRITLTVSPVILKVREWVRNG